MARHRAGRTAVGGHHRRGSPGIQHRAGMRPWTKRTRAANMQRMPGTQAAITTARARCKLGGRAGQFLSSKNERGHVAKI
eukprot:12503304-Heterocapsa_arctica.AAC.1